MWKRETALQAVQGTRGKVMMRMMKMMMMRATTTIESFFPVCSATVKKTLWRSRNAKEKRSESWSTR